MAENKEQITAAFESNLNRAAAYIDGNQVGECEFCIQGNIWSITHTGVDPAFGGRGIAKLLVLKVIEEARRQQVKIVPVCSYAKHMMEGKDEYGDVLEK